MLTAEWLQSSTVLLATEYDDSRQIIIILFYKYLLDIRSEAWLILFWEYIKVLTFSCNIDI